MVIRQNPETESLNLPAFEGFPYLWTRIVGAIYHVIPLPNNLRPDALKGIARRQVAANKLRTCLVLAADQCVYFEIDGNETPSKRIPRGGIIVSGRVRTPGDYSQTGELLGRIGQLQGLQAHYPADRVILGDLTKGGRPATPEESVRLEGKQASGVPKGLVRCAICGDWRGECLDPNPRFKDMIMQVHCLCENDNLCARCGFPLADRKLNANYYLESDGEIWHVPGFEGLSHQCFEGISARQTPALRTKTGERGDAKTPVEWVLIYGQIDNSLVFIPRHRAIQLANIQDALWSSATWSEFKSRVPDTVYQDVLTVLYENAVYDFDYFYKEKRESEPDITREAARRAYEVLSIGDRPPEENDIFNPENVPGVSDGDWPGWPAQEMIGWVPDVIQKDYGRRSSSFVSGDCLLFDPARERQIVEAFERSGYRCVKDDLLVRRASGYSE